jgi:hypothetical protein
MVNEAGIVVTGSLEHNDSLRSACLSPRKNSAPPRDPERTNAKDPSYRCIAVSCSILAGSP